MKTDHRKSVRYPIVAEARIVSDQHPDGLFAIVRDVSDEGCKLYGSKVTQASDRFTLFALEGGEEVEFDCRVAWRSEQAIGVRFVGRQRVGAD